MLAALTAVGLWAGRDDPVSVEATPLPQQGVLRLAAGNQTAVPIDVRRDIAAVWYSFTSENGTQVLASIAVAPKPMQASGSAFVWARSAGAHGFAGITLMRGTYHLRFTCSMYQGPCAVNYTLEILPEGSSSGVRDGFSRLQFKPRGGCPASAFSGSPVAWQAGVAKPDSPTFLLLDAEPGDVITAGRDLAYTPYDARFTLRVMGNGLSADVHGDSVWSLTFRPPEGCERLAVGTFTDLLGHRPGSGLFSFSNCTGGTVTVDDVRHDEQGLLTRLEMRFALPCGGRENRHVLHGAFSWGRGTDRPPMECTGAPLGANGARLAGWTPDLAPGNSMYWVGETASFLGSTNRTWTPADGSLTATFDGHKITVMSKGPSRADWDFMLPDSCSWPKPGAYGELRDQYEPQPVRGGLDVGSGCHAAGAYVIDEAELNEDRSLRRIVLRFELHCQGRQGPQAAAVLGRVEWSAERT